MILKKRNVEIICNVMDWYEPIFCDGGANGYLTWKNCTQEEVKEIEEKTGIKCHLTKYNRLVVPYYVEK